MDRSTVDDSSARAQEARWDDFASTSTTRQWEGSLRVAEQPCPCSSSSHLSHQRGCGSAINFPCLYCTFYRVAVLAREAETGLINSSGGTALSSFSSITGGRGDRVRQVQRTKIRTKKPPLTRAIPATRRTRCIPSRKMRLPFRIAPSTATPSAAPTCRLEFSAPEAIPARSFGAAAITATV